MYQPMSRKRAHMVNSGLLISMLLLAACGSFGTKSDGSQNDDMAAAVNATVAVAVEQTVAARTAGTVTEEVAAQAPAESSQVDQAALAEQRVEEISAAPSDNSRAIVDYLIANGRHFTGNPNADVVIIEFSDFQ